jgi:hypothetical protein
LPPYSDVVPAWVTHWWLTVVAAGVQVMLSHVSSLLVVCPAVPA